MSNPMKLEPVDLFESDQDPSAGFIGGSPDDVGGSLHAESAVIEGSNGLPVTMAEVGVNYGPYGYARVFLGPRDARELARWLNQWADWREAQGV